MPLVKVVNIVKLGYFSVPCLSQDEASVTSLTFYVPVA